jgi:hypothetical protein
MEDRFARKMEDVEAEGRVKTEVTKDRGKMEDRFARKTEELEDQRTT